MERQDVFLIIIIGVIVFLYLTRMYESYVSGSYDITPAITVGMDWKGSQVSTMPYYPNNLNNPPQNVDIEMRRLQSYQPNADGQTTSTYVSAQMNNISNSNNLDNLEGFTMMNPFISE